MLSETMALAASLQHTIIEILLAKLRDFAKKHMPEELADITNKYNEVYEKRHIRLEERKAALLEQTEETEQPQSEEVPQRATEEQQSEVAA